MRLKYRLPLIGALMMFVPLAANAAAPQLAEPVVALMPQVKQMRASLNLNEQQARALDNWMAEAPVRRKQMEGEMRELRTQMREAILNNESRLVRESLKQQIADKEMRLIEMRALCVRMLRKTLNEDQFAKVVAAYRAEVQG